MGMFTYFLFKTVLTVKQRPSYRAMMNAAKDPNLTQEEVLKRIVHTNRDTEFGRKHQFNGIETVEQYRKQVPVHDFELLRPYIEKQRDTGAEALTAEPVVHYNRTSGTTGTPKDVPITQTGVGETRQLSQLGAFA
ncbi:MAG: GH3 auxin-responsive promoter family protein, partial [Gammaproteobacteria bacterium]|nr:GH3 auxin-responsive promoter family protein [Gammaproteobacteria bacterium]